MAVEVGLSDGTKLQLSNPAAQEDGVVRSIQDNPGGVMTVNSTDGRYRVLIEHVVYVRTVDLAAGAHVV
jgi:hypothetical protein